MAPDASQPADEPPRFTAFLRLKLPLLVGASVLLIAGLLLSLLWVPALTRGFSAPVAQRVFYFHLGAGITSYIAFSVTFVASLVYMKTRRLLYDTIARDSALLALVFALMMLTSGPMWGWAEWGVAWRFEDVRLTTYTILALVYMGYLAIRARLHEPSERARVAALYAAAGYVFVPVSYLSLYFWQSLHPRVISPGGQGIGAQGGMVLGVAIIGFALLFLGLLAARLELSMLEERVATLQRRADA
jgi:heme exporter protein C